MKYAYLSLLCLSSLLGVGQTYPKFELTVNGIEPIVVQFDSMTAPVLYAKAFKWVQKNYKNPEKVLKANLANEELRIGGYRVTLR